MNYTDTIESSVSKTAIENIKFSSSQLTHIYPFYIDVPRASYVEELKEALQEGNMWNGYYDVGIDKSRIFSITYETNDPDEFSDYFAEDLVDYIKSIVASI